MTTQIKLTFLGGTMFIALFATYMGLAKIIA